MNAGLPKCLFFIGVASFTVSAATAHESEINDVDKGIAGAWAYIRVCDKNLFSADAKEFMSRYTNLRHDEVMTASEWIDENMVDEKMWCSTIKPHAVTAARDLDKQAKELGIHPKQLDPNRKIYPLKTTPVE